MQSLAYASLAEGVFQMAHECTIKAPNLTDRPMADFFRHHRRDFFFINEAFGDDSRLPTPREIEGKRYRVRIYRICPEGHSVSTNTCMEFLRSQGAVLLGAYGAVMLHEQWQGKLPRGLWMLSFSESGEVVPRLFYQTDRTPPYTRVTRLYQRPQDSDRPYTALERWVRRITGEDRPILNLGRSNRGWDTENALVSFVPM